MTAQISDTYLQKTKGLKHNRTSDLPKLFEILSHYCDRPRLFQSSFVYDNLKQMIPIKRKLLVATNFLKKLYVYLGFQPAYK
jgi:hypothetical protein